MKKYKNSSIKHWALEDRPREKLISRGLSSLTNAELLAIIIGSGTQSGSAVELSKQLLNLAGNNLNELGKLGIQDLKKVSGIGTARALSVVSALELGRRRNLSAIPEKKKITGSHDIFKLLHPVLGDLKHEEFWIILLSRSNIVIDQVKISQGGISGTIIDARIILKNAVERLASSLILCHNHPSGNLNPSDADIRITNKIKQSADLMDVKLLDHIIVADNSYFSFSDEGLI